MRGTELLLINKWQTKKLLNQISELPIVLLFHLKSNTFNTFEYSVNIDLFYDNYFYIIIDIYYL